MVKESDKNLDPKESSESGFSEKLPNIENLPQEDQNFNIEITTKENFELCFINS